ncbi:MAG TPA: ABC transporter permease subunit, partial [Burkholderiales bacterium]
MTWIGRGIIFGLLAFIVLGPLANLVLWAAAEQWYFPHKLPVTYGTKFWAQVFKPRGDALVSLVTSVWIALATVAASLALAVPAGYALARLKLPWRTAILLAFLLPQAFPSLAVYINIARLFYDVRLNGTMTGVIMVHTVHGLVFAVWITAAAFAAVDRDLELAARNLGASGVRTFLT